MNTLFLVKPYRLRRSALRKFRSAFTSCPVAFHEVVTRMRQVGIKSGDVRLQRIGGVAWRQS